MPKAHPWNFHPIWARNEPATCPTCQAPFIRRHIRQKFCNPKCRYPKITPNDKLIFERFEILCKKLNLSIWITSNKVWYREDRPYNLLKRQEPRTAIIGKQKKERMILALKAFCDQMESGYWNLIEPQGHQRWRRLERRMTKQEKTCPRKLPGCIGHFLPHYCPRNFKECPLV